MPKRNRYHLPRNLTFEKARSFFRYRNPVTGKRTYVGKDEFAPIEMAEKANLVLKIQKILEKTNKQGGDIYDLQAFTL